MKNNNNKNSSNSEKRHSKVEDDSGNISDSSDISTFTDMKVFNGALKNLARINQSNQIPHKKSLEDKNSEKTQEENGIPSHKKYTEIYITDDTPISFRNQSIDENPYEMENFSKEKENNHESHKKIEKIIKSLNKNKSLEDKIINDVHKDFKEIEKFSKISKKSKNNEDKFLKIIKDSFQGEFDEDDEGYKHIYNRSNSLNRLDRRCRSRCTKFTSDNYFLKLKPFKNQSQNSSNINCTLSRIDKGIAIFVSENHCVFSLPACFLTNDMQLGNSYKISIHEILTVSKKFQNIQEMQKKFII